MHDRVLWMIGLLVLFGTAPVCAQSLSADGTVTELSGDRVVVERDTSVSVSENEQGQVFATTRLGDDRQKILAAALRVTVVSGAIVVGQIAARSDLMDVSVGQKVSFSTEMPKASMRGTLAVQSTPSGAQVELVSLSGAGRETRQLGTTPVRRSIEPGRYRVRVKKDTYRTTTQTVRVRGGGTRTVEPSLEARTGTLVVRPTPDTASVVVDGQPLGEGTIRDTLEVGRHEVTVDADGFTSASRRVRIEDERTKSLAPSLDRKMGTLKVSAAPSGAEVQVDGTKIGQTPVEKTYPTGMYEVQVIKAGFKPVTKSVAIQGETAQSVNVELQRPIEVELGSVKGPVRQVEMRRKDRQLVVQYSLSGKEEEYEVELQFSSDGGESYEEIEEAVAGDLGEEVAPGKNKEVRWTVLEQFPEGIYGDGYRLRVEAEEAFQAGGVTIQVMSRTNDMPNFGGATVGWTGENGHVTLSYSEPTRFSGFYTEEVKSIGLRAGPVWRLGWLSVKPLAGLAYRGGDFVGQGGSGVYLGRTVYVGTELVYSVGLESEADLGAFFILGVAF